MKVFVRDVIRDTVHVAELKEGENGGQELWINGQQQLFSAFEILKQEEVNSLEKDR